MILAANGWGSIQIPGSDFVLSTRYAFTDTHD